MKSKHQLKAKNRIRRDYVELANVGQQIEVCHETKKNDKHKTLIRLLSKESALRLKLGLTR